MYKPMYRALIRNLHSLGLADKNADVNVFRKGRNPALVWAADHAPATVVKALLARGANVDARDKVGRTALHYAAWNGDFSRKNVHLLIAAGADVNAKDREGLTPLMVAQGDANIRTIRNQRPSMTLRQEVEIVLKPLLGLRLSDMWRAAGMQIFEIGPQLPFRNRKGKNITKAEQSLHVSCCWFIAGLEGEIVSSDDFGPDRTRRDEKAKPFYKMLGDPALTITCIQADDYGGIRLRMSGGYVLEIWPCWGDAEKQEDDALLDTEDWRFLPKDENRRHFVINAGSIERY